MTPLAILNFITRHLFNYVLVRETEDGKTLRYYWLTADEYDSRVNPIHITEDPKNEPRDKQL